MSEVNGTVPQPVYLASIYAVGDYEVWRREQRRALRVLARHGVTRHWFFRGADDQKEIMAIFELPSQEQAERLLTSKELNVSGWMDRIGLEIYPGHFVGQPVEMDEAASPEQLPGPAAD
jgi:hypothetical protein